ncbi:MAG: biosynthetic-type acetolactate synthase large subunit [Gammaproteobacteria bacterium]|nr:biosynthetic-type acetolactate synthase large subunit [Gammaproteobacteria bacterium]
MQLSGAQILVQFLQDEGVECIFGFPGGSVLHIYDELYKQDAIKHILVRHEQGAAHAADGYARVTGRPGVALVTSGPGATNTVTGIATAYMDSIPIVVITGQVPTPWIGSDAFQEADTIGITRPCVKHNFLVKDVRDLADTLKKAFYIATTGRPGPVVVDVPKDVTDPKVRIPYTYPKKVSLRSYNPVVKGHPGQIKKACDLLLSAKRPIFYTGGGVLLGNGSGSLTELVHMLGYPITQTLMGLGAFPGSDKQFLGMLGMHGTYEANMAMHECDVLLAVGARFDDRVTGVLETFCPHAKIIHIDVDPASISKNVPVDVPIVGQVDSVLKEMIKVIKAGEKRPDEAVLAKWWKQIEKWRSLECLSYEKRQDVIKPQYVVETLSRLTKGQAIIASDVGQHQMWTAQFYKFQKPRHWLSSGGLGTMGFGLPAAMGAQIANPEATVACFTGDGSIQMCIQELATCKQFELPLKIICMNNRYLGMVRQWQEFFYENRYSHTYMDALPDFVALAEAYGHSGTRIHSPDEVEPAMEKMLKTDGLVFLDVITDPTENVYPMIEAGKGHHEMHMPPHLSTGRELS